MKDKSRVQNKNLTACYFFSLIAMTHNQVSHHHIWMNTMILRCLI